MISKSLLLLIVAVRAQDMNSSMMDPSMMNSSMTSAMMTPWSLHFTLGDALWFSAWIPQSKGALAGAAIGLFFMAIAERWFASMRASTELHWRARMNKKILTSSSVEEGNEEKDRVTNDDYGLSVLAKNSNSPPNVRYAPPFVFSHNIARGVMFGFSAFINFLFMLAVMTYQAAFLIAIVFGLGTGEMLFGRVAPGARDVRARG